MKKDSPYFGFCFLHNNPTWPLDDWETSEAAEEQCCKANVEITKDSEEVSENLAIEIDTKADNRTTETGDTQVGL